MRCHLLGDRLDVGVLAEASIHLDAEDAAGVFWLNFVAFQGYFRVRTLPSSGEVD